MAVQSPVDPIENRLRRWQREAGWWDHERDAPNPLPFAMPNDPTSPLTAAEDEEDELLTHYVDSVLVEVSSLEAMSSDQSCMPAMSSDEVGDTEALLEKGTHALVFAHSGEGKSACRIRHAKEADTRGFLVVDYRTVGREKRTSKEHALAIDGLIWEAIHRTGSSVIVVQPVQSKEPLQQLKTLTERLVPGYYKGIFIFVDNVEDNLGPAWSLDDVGNAIEPLFDPDLIGIKGLAFKLLLPRDLARRVSRYSVVKSSSKYRFRLFCINWNQERLRRCLEDRLRDARVASAPQSLGAIAEDSFPFLDNQVIDVALSMPGAPRNLFRLVHEMIISHVRRERDPTKYRLTPEDFEQARQHVFLARIESEKERQKELLHRRESQLVDARQTGDQQLIAELAPLLVQQHQETTLWHQQVLSLLQTGTLGESTVAQLQEISSQLLRMGTRQEEVYTEIMGVRALVVLLPADLLAAYDEGNRVVVSTLLGAMTRLHLESVRLTVQAIDKASLGYAEMQEALTDVRSVLQVVRTEVAELPSGLRESLASLDAEIDKAPDIAHKLKLSIPFLVFFSYEIEIKQDLRAQLASVRDKILAAVWNRKESIG